MPVIRCDVTDCEYATADVGDAAGAVLLTHHFARDHPVAPPPKAPPIKQPSVAGGIYEDSWNSFVREWEVFKNGSSLNNANSALYLLNCCDSALRASVHKEDPVIATKTEVEVLAAIKRLSVVSVATCVLQTELLSLKQDHQEQIRNFAAKAQGKAANCKLNKTVSYTHLTLPTKRIV